MVAADGFLRRFGRALQGVAGLETVGQVWNTDEVFSPVAPPTDADQIGRTLPPREYPAELPPEEEAPDGGEATAAPEGTGPAALPDLDHLFTGAGDDPAPQADSDRTEPTPRS